MQATGLNVIDISDNGSKGFTVNGKKYFAVRKKNAIFVYQNECPHIGIALDWVEHQFLDNSCSMIQCANHGALFVIETGKCVAGPCTGQKLTSVSFQIINGEIFIL